MMAFPIPKEDRKRWIVGLALLSLAVFLVYRAFFAVSSPVRRSPRAGTGEVVNLEGRPQARVVRGPASTRGRWIAPSAPSGALDPTLRLDLLTKVAGITYKGSERNIFQYQTTAPPIPKPLANPVTKPGEKTAVTPPPPPPIPLKYYGYAHKPSETAKRAFFVEGEEIFIAGEGEIVNKRYKILKIGVNTVEVEDQVTKNKQTLPLLET